MLDMILENKYDSSEYHDYCCIFYYIFYIIKSKYIIVINIPSQS